MKETSESRTHTGHASSDVWYDLEGEGYWAEIDAIRTVLKKDKAGWWHEWLVIPSSGGASYHAFRRSLVAAKQNMCSHATEFLKNAYCRETTDAISLSWHPIGPGGRFILLKIRDIITVEECNPGAESECVQDHGGVLMGTFDSRMAAENRISDLLRSTDGAA